MMDLYMIVILLLIALSLIGFTAWASAVVDEGSEPR